VPFEVQSDNEVELVFGEILGSAAERRTSTIDEDIHPAMVALDAGGKREHCSRSVTSSATGDCGAAPGPRLSPRRLGAGEIYVRYNQRSTPTWPNPMAHRGAKTAAAARDDSNPAGHPKICET